MPIKTSPGQLPSAAADIFFSFLSQRRQDAKKSNRSLPSYCNHGFESTWYLVLGTSYNLLGTWYFVPLTWYLLLATWYSLLSLFSFSRKGAKPQRNLTAPCLFFLVSWFLSLFSCLSSVLILTTWYLILPLVSFFFSLAKTPRRKEI